MSTAKPRFTVVYKPGGMPYEFFSIGGAHQWLWNLKEEGKDTEGATIYDEEKREYIIPPKLP